MKTILIITSLFFLTIYSSEKLPLTKDQALSLAVKLSNDECKKQFDIAPFKTKSFNLEFENDFWIWGGLSESGINGYSVHTKFNKYGLKDTVQVFFSVDAYLREEDY